MRSARHSTYSDLGKGTSRSTVDRKVTIEIRWDRALHLRGGWLASAGRRFERAPV